MPDNQKTRAWWNTLKITLFMFIFLSFSFLAACSLMKNESVVVDYRATEDAFDARVEAVIAGRMATEEAFERKVAERVNATVTAISAHSVQISNNVTEQNNTSTTDEPDKEANTANEPDEDANRQLEQLLDDTDNSHLDSASGGGGSISATLAHNTNIRTGPGAEYPLITTLISGSGVELLGKSCNGCPGDNLWYKVQLPNGSEGWAISWAFNNGFSLSANLNVAYAPPPPRAFPTVTPTTTPTPIPTATPTATATATATATSAPDTAITVIVVNSSSLTVCQLLIHPSTAPSDTNRLGLDPLPPNSQIAVTLIEGATFYDFEARACGDNSLIAKDSGIQVFNNFVWNIKE
jgi:hypothetical protein